MTQLRDRMLEELERRNYSPGTARCYLYAVQQFAEHFHRAPDPSVITLKPATCDQCKTGHLSRFRLDCFTPRRPMSARWGRGVPGVSKFRRNLIVDAVGRNWCRFLYYQEDGWP